MTTAVEIPAATDDASGMAFRIVVIASSLANLGIKPLTLSCYSHVYLYGQPKIKPYGGDYETDPSAADGVEVHVSYDEFHRLARTWSLGVDADKDENVYASGIVNGVAVLVFAGKPTGEAVAS